MDKIFIVYLIVVGFILSFGIYTLMPRHSIHPMGLNSTRINDTTCRYTWLGGTDYDSFVENLTVDRKPVGHPLAYSVIHTGNCSAKVCMYMKDVKSYVEIYPKAYQRC